MKIWLYQEWACLLAILINISIIDIGYSSYCSTTCIDTTCWWIPQIVKYKSPSKIAPPLTKSIMQEERGREKIHAQHNLIGHARLYYERKNYL